MERERKIKRAKKREKKRGETGGEDEGTPVKFFVKSLDRRQRLRNMNPRSGQSKQESYVIMLTEIGFSRV